MNTQYVAKSDVGNIRKTNEDSYCADPSIGLFIVADGMGGQAAGEVASQTTVEVIKNGMVAWLNKYQPSQELFAKAIRVANTAVHELARRKAGMKGMGTTVSGILLDSSNNRYYVANVGDSRVYRIRGGKIEQLTMDHSLVALQLSMGIITPDEAKKASHRNVITQAIGAAESVNVDTKAEDILSDDLILICSDGLSSLVDDADMLNVVGRYKDNLDHAADELISLANFNGGSDNISVILVRFTI